MGKFNGPKGKKTSPFIGQKVPLVSNGAPLLYQRYTNVEEILLDAPKPSSADATITDNTTQKEDAPTAKALSKAEKKAARKRKQAEGAEEEKEKVTGEDNAGVQGEETQQAENQGGQKSEDGQVKKKKKKEKKEKKALPEAKKTSGPGNADEAHEMRVRLGYVSGTAIQEQAPAGKFSFKFSVQPGSEAHADADGDGADANGDSNNASGDGAAAVAEAHKEPAAEAAGGVQHVSFRGRNGIPEATTRAVQEEMSVRLARVLGEDVPRRVYVGGMPFSYTEEDVRAYWEYCGEIESMDMMTFPDTGRFKGIVFITFKTEEAFQEALKCDGTEVDGQTLKVKTCKASAKRDKGGRERPGRNVETGANHAPKTVGYNVAYIGNISFEASEDDLKAALEGCAVTLVRLHTDKDTGRFKGFAHVHFGDEASLDRAVGLNGVDVRGRKLRVGYAQPKKAA